MRRNICLWKSFNALQDSVSGFVEPVLSFITDYRIRFIIGPEKLDLIFLPKVRKIEPTNHFSISTLNITRITMDYILILERDESVHEMYLNYCQWTHNEAEMTKLIKYIKTVQDEHTETLGANTSRFYIAEGFVPESVVDGLKALSFSHDVPNPFYKYEGRFTCPSFLKKDRVFEDDDDDDDDKDSDDASTPKCKDTDDMDLDEELEEVDPFE